MMSTVVMDQRKPRHIKKDQREHLSIAVAQNRDTIAGDSDVSLKERLDDALRRIASLQQDLKEIRREIATVRT